VHDDPADRAALGDAEPEGGRPEAREGRRGALAVPPRGGRALDHASGHEAPRESTEAHGRCVESNQAGASPNGSSFVEFVICRTNKYAARKCVNLWLIQGMEAPQWYVTACKVAEGREVYIVHSEDVDEAAVLEGIFSPHQQPMTGIGQQPNSPQQHSTAEASTMAKPGVARFLAMGVSA